MNNQSIKKILLFFCLTLTVFFTANVKSFASDYQYKVLDPRYNPQAEQLLNGTLADVQTVNLKEPKSFDAGDFFAIFALVVFPIIIIALVIKTLKEMKDEVPGVKNLSEGNINIARKNDNANKNQFRDNGRNLMPRNAENVPQKSMQGQTQNTVKNKAAGLNKQPVRQHSSQAEQPVKRSDKPISQVAMMKPVNPLKSSGISPNGTVPGKINIRPALPARPLSQKEKLPQAANISISKYFSSPERKIKNPVLLNTSMISKNKGLCLVEYNEKYSLIGYINNEIFMLNQFDSLQTNEIRSRLSESVDSKDRYIVRLGGYKALVEVSDTNMKLLLEL